MKTSVQETPKNKPFKDTSLEEAVFSNHVGSCRKKRTLGENSKTHKVSLAKSRLSEVLNASQYGALEYTLPLTRSLRKSHKYKGIDPKLGYDWIAGLLDNSSYVSQCSDEYFDELKEFRRANREECCRTMSARLNVYQYLLLFLCSGLPDASDNETTPLPSSKTNEITQQDVGAGRD